MELTDVNLATAHLEPDGCERRRTRLTLAESALRLGGDGLGVALAVLGLDQVA